MAADVVFVHGTGVREPAYSKTLALISRKLKGRLPELRVHPCYWGGPHGSTLGAGGQTIPGFDTARALDGELDDEEFLRGLWRLLYQDPLLELRLLDFREEAALGIPGHEPPGEELDAAFTALIPSAQLQALLEETGLDRAFGEARAALVRELDYVEAMARAQEPLGEYRRALARAWVAQSVLLTREAEGELAYSLDAETRERMVELLVEELGGDERGPGAWLWKAFWGVVKRAGTHYALGKRGHHSEHASGGAGDILMYQARGAKLRQFVGEALSALPGPVVVIAHSLGGIISVDLLLEAGAPKVDLLITVGSQSPLLYELNALVGRPFDPNGRLPETFPPWINCYDPHDFLSYLGEPVFPGQVRDVRVDSGQPFPESHGAYWMNDRFWDAVERELRARGLA